MIQLENIDIELDSKETLLQGDLLIPTGSKGLVMFAHGSGSSRFSPRNRYVAQILNQAGLGTLLFDLLTEEEEAVDMYNREFRFNIDLLAQRLQGATDWVERHPDIDAYNLGYFGSSTGAAAALIASVQTQHKISAIVSRGGRTDLAAACLEKVKAPTLFIVGGDDKVVIELNQHSFEKLSCTKEITIIEGATHLFEEPGKLEEVAQTAAHWFSRYLQ